MAATKKIEHPKQMTPGDLRTIAVNQLVWIARYGSTDESRVHASEVLWNLAKDL
jgi:hypothetical protein